MLRSLLLSAATAAALHGPGPIQSLGSALQQSGGQTVIGDGARYVAFPRSATRLAIHDAQRRRTFTIAADCTRSVLAVRPGLFLEQCDGYGGPNAVVVDATTRKVHWISAQFASADGATVTWTGLGPRYARYDVAYDCNVIDCAGGTYVVNWRTDTVRRERGTDCCPHPPLARLRLLGGPKPGMNDGGLWLLDAKTRERKRIGKDCYRHCAPHLAAGWASWTEGYDAPFTINAYNVTTHAHRTWKVAGTAAPEQARAGRTLVVASGPGGASHTRRISLVRLPPPRG